MNKLKMTLFDERKAFSSPSKNSKPKILFIGLSESSHARHFSELFTDDFDVNFFALPTFSPPNSWPVKTYITSSNPPINMDPVIRISLHPTLESINSFIRDISRRRPFSQFIRRIIEEVFSSLNILFKRHITLDDLKPPKLKMKAASPYHWLSEIIQLWEPDIIHTFGVDGGIFLQDSWELFHKPNSLPCTWFLQVRGASDITLRRNLPDKNFRLLKCLNDCDWIIGDNSVELNHIVDLGIDKGKIAPFCPIPGSGGIDFNSIKPTLNNKKPKERAIVWPKAFNCVQSLSYPVLEAIKLAWDQIQPCTIHLLAIDEPTRKWFYLLPESIIENCVIHDRIPRKEVIDLFISSRVMLAPALFDGIPNVMYEAMVAGSIPIVSPLDTIKSLVSKENVLFAENMSPREIADALIFAMTNDKYVSKIVNRNYSFVKNIFDREIIKNKLLTFYSSILESNLSKKEKQL